MCTLNKIGQRFAELPGVHAMTDVTGFGLAGHLLEMCEGSGVSARLNFKGAAAAGRGGLLPERGLRTGRYPAQLRLLW